MKRFKLEVIYHMPDDWNEGVFADQLEAYMREFVVDGRSRNASRPHFDSCAVSVERKTWEAPR